MEKYLHVAKNTWDEILMYRLNFSMWRVRTVLQLLTVYFLWAAILPKQGTLFDYSESLMLTYILGTSFISSIVLSTRTHEIGENINNGDLSIFLLRPMNYFAYWFWRDIGDKAMNIAFSIVELTLLFTLLQPPLFVQTNPLYLSFTVVSVILAVFLYFLISCLLGLIGFWSPEVWGPRFLFYIVITFFAGGLFPLDIFPTALYNAFQLLPFSYLLYFPLKIYLGQLAVSHIYTGLFVAVVWILLLAVVVNAVWKKGLTTYSAVGR